MRVRLLGGGAIDKYAVSGHAVSLYTTTKSAASEALSPHALHDDPATLAHIDSPLMETLRRGNFGHVLLFRFERAVDEARFLSSLLTPMSKLPYARALPLESLRASLRQILGHTTQRGAQLFLACTSFGKLQIGKSQGRLADMAPVGATLQPDGPVNGEQGLCRALRESLLKQRRLRDGIASGYSERWRLTPTGRLKK